jgi:hypothetical protein
MQTRKPKKGEGKVSECSKGIEGKYANYFKVGYNAFEFVVDFGQNYSENDEAELYTRVILAPAFAKALHASLEDSIRKYEKKFGKIQNSIPDGAVKSK